MHILEALKRTTSEERREIGEIFLAFADGKERPNLTAEIDLVLSKFRDPKEADRAALLEAGRKRVHALSDGLRADGMGHEQLIEAELKRRGDGRTVNEYCKAVCDGSSLPHSDISVTDVFS
ncbi:hypothetical protein [Novosphingobium sp. ES2-1]|uniref:hypothetical protein n=1 Tax=Novosphingobium sp. ES2-1 TaxID=2780074 RepID=UPI001881C291|nr:hypothetical protein [Novosphingobium sp. ES2-1]QOV92942.1 hypothetical protein IM701_09720 [Novosphingobium sp. ES2-1]